MSDDAMRRWRKRRRRLRRRLRRAGDVVLIGLVVVVVWFAVHRRHTSSASATSTTAKIGSLDATYPPQADVAVQSCVFANFTVKGTVFVYNHTPTPQTYYIDVLFKNGGRKYAEGVVRTGTLKTRHHTFAAVVTASRAAPPKHLTCVVNGVERLAG